ncbi:MAG: hypothetical protein ACK2UB_09405 [Anaerolineales bacterium]
MRSKRTLLIAALGGLAAVLSACQGGASAEGSMNDGEYLTAEYENAIPVESQLILGTLMLEDTEQAVDAEQAAELLPLWQMQKALAASDTASTEEKDALIDQIQETMTREQIRAIAEMQLTQQDLFTYMQQAGLVQRPQYSGTPGASTSGGGGFPGGEGPMIVEGDGPPAGFEGGPPAGFQGGQGRSGYSGSGQGFNPEDLTAEQRAILEARRASGGGLSMTSSALLESLIELLETKQAA